MKNYIFFPYILKNWKGGPLFVVVEARDSIHAVELLNKHYPGCLNGSGGGGSLVYAELPSDWRASPISSLTEMYQSIIRIMGYSDFCYACEEAGLDSEKISWCKAIWLATHPEIARRPKKVPFLSIGMSPAPLRKVSCAGAKPDLYDDLLNQARVHTRGNSGLEFL